jgi:hypothetical protein
VDLNHQLDLPHCLNLDDIPQSSDGNTSKIPGIAHHFIDSAPPHTKTSATHTQQAQSLTQ